MSSLRAKSDSAHFITQTEQWTPTVRRGAPPKAQISSSAPKKRVKRFVLPAFLISICIMMRFESNKLKHQIARHHNNFYRFTLSPSIRLSQFQN